MAAQLVGAAQVTPQQLNYTVDAAEFKDSVKE